MHKITENRADFQGNNDSYINMISTLEETNKENRALINDLASAAEQSGYSFVGKWLEMISTISNTKYYPYLNAEVIRDGIDTQGLNIVQGFLKWMEDIKNERLPKLSELESFRIGENIATTKGEVIYRNHIMEVIHYVSPHKKTYSEPLLIVPPWINKYYVMDMNPETSFVQYCLDMEFDVYLIVWKSADASSYHLGMEDYIEYAIKKTMRIIETKLHIIGYCVGGIGALLSTMTDDHRQINSLTLMATPIDFSLMYEMRNILLYSSFNKIAQKIEERGYQCGNDLLNMFCMLKPEGLILNQIVEQYYLNKNPKNNALLYWNMDTVNIPAKLHLEYLRDFVLNNSLVLNQLTYKDQQISMDDLKTPTYVIGAETDHIVPYQSAFALRSKNTHIEYVLTGSGHISGIINHPGKEKYHYTYYDNKKQQLVKDKGSWWPHWVEWVKSNMSSTKKTPPKENNQILCDAPGTYVLDQKNLFKGR